jgi:replicative DNA helicase
MERVNSDYLEKIIVKGMTSDKDFLVLVSSVFEAKYFDDPYIRHAFDFCKNYFGEHNDIPSKDTIINSTEENVDGLRSLLNEVEELDFNVADGYQFLLDQSNDYLKEKALKSAIIESVDEVEDPERRNSIRDRIEYALVKDLKIDLGLHYFEHLGERLRRIFTASENKVPTYFPVFDEFINGGFPPFTLSILTAKIHGGKSNTMANFAARQVLNGLNPVVISLEMAEDAFAQRFDGIYSCMDINRMYLSNTYRRQLMARLTETKSTEGRGELFIKQFPTGEASVLDFKIYLRELIMRDVHPDILYVDYINLMKTAYKVENNLYSTVKRVAEELRALSFEFEIPVVSVSQLNREGTYINFESLDFQYIAESLGVPATCDFMAILGTDEDQMIYQNEILYKITKNRLGGRVGQWDKFYLDARSLKMYDSCELDPWIEDAEISGDDRTSIDQVEEEEQNV